MNSWPYAQNCPNDSVGEFRTILSPKLIGSIKCWEAHGEARRQFNCGLKEEVLRYLNRHSVRALESGSYLSILLFMVGKHPHESKPTVMFASDDKVARKEAFGLIRTSGIMDGFPGFEIGHCKYEKLMAVAGDATNIYSRTSDNVECRRLFTHPQSSLGPQGRMATAGGVVNYNGRHMILTADHFLQDPVSIQPGVQENDSDDDDSECEITGFGAHDSSSFVDSKSPASYSETSGGEDGQSDNISDASSGSTPGIADELSPEASYSQMSRFDAEIGIRNSVMDVEPFQDSFTMIGNVVLRSRMFDYALIEVDEMSPDLSALRDTSIPLDLASCVQSPELDMAIQTTTPDGSTLHGNLSCTSYSVRFPRSSTFIEVYAARFDRPLRQGDSGSWVRDVATGLLLGYVFAGSLVDGLTAIMPARLVFEHARVMLNGLRAGQPLQEDSSVSNKTIIATASEAMEEAYERRLVDASRLTQQLGDSVHRAGLPSFTPPRTTTTQEVPPTTSSSFVHDITPEFTSFEQPRSSTKTASCYSNTGVPTTEEYSQSHDSFSSGKRNSGFDWVGDSTSDEILVKTAELLGLQRQLQPQPPHKRLFASPPGPEPMERSSSDPGINISSTAIKNESDDRIKGESDGRIKGESDDWEIVQLPLYNDRATALANTHTTLRSKVTLKESHKYRRSSRPRVMCPQCNENPDGFRGEHELKRHISAKHDGGVTKWICRDPIEVGITSHLHPTIPLSACRACSSKKRYGAYYNAAAHLRRAHFNRRPDRRGVAARVKRSDLRGADFPAMEDLRAWFEVIEVKNSESITESSREEGLDSSFKNSENEVARRHEGGGISTVWDYDIPDFVNGFSPFMHLGFSNTAIVDSVSPELAVVGHEYMYRSSLDLSTITPVRDSEMSEAPRGESETFHEV